MDDDSKIFNYLLAGLAGGFIALELSKKDGNFLGRAKKAYKALIESDEGASR